MANSIKGESPLVFLLHKTLLLDLLEWYRFSWQMLSAKICSKCGMWLIRVINAKYDGLWFCALFIQIVYSIHTKSDEFSIIIICAPLSAQIEFNFFWLVSGCWWRLFWVGWRLFLEFHFSSSKTTTTTTTNGHQNYSSSSFWKGTLPPYRETIDSDDNSIASPNSFHSIEDDGERDGNQSTQDDMILSNRTVNETKYRYSFIQHWFYSFESIP